MFSTFCVQESESQRDERTVTVLVKKHIKVVHIICVCVIPNHPKPYNISEKYLV